MVKDNLNTGSFHRAIQVGKLGLGITGSYVGYQMQNWFLDPESREKKRKSFHRKSGRRICQELQSLRGPVMKLGQALSMQTQWIPEEAIEELAELQTRAPAMHPTLMRTQFKQALGRYPEEIFARFSREPFAAASLGQVHHAVTRNGEEVAVKMQYPAIRDAVRNDFALLRSLTWPARLAKWVTMDMLEEIERGILLETDYRQEARNVTLFHEQLKALPYVRVPRVLDEYSTEKVLTLSFMRGEFLDAWLESHPGQADRDRLGARLFELFFYQFLRMNVIHADPHPGNYLYDADGNVSLIDFGCVKHLSRRILDYIQGFSLRPWETDEAEFLRILNSVFGGSIDPARKKDQRLIEAVIQFNDTLLPRRNEDPCVDFGQSTVLNRMFQAWNAVSKHSAPDPEFFFLCRTELGLCNTLYQLRARVNTVEIADRAAYFRQGEVRVPSRAG
ncbi:MAG: ABC1 kinase family protein [bacterium]